MNLRLLVVGFFAILIMACGGDLQEGKLVEEVPSEVKINKPIPTRPKPRKPVASETPADTINVARFAFTEEFYDFGTVNEGEVLTHTFKFKNIGKAPLIISKANSTCGCTVPEFSKKPVPVGEMGSLSVRFNTKGKKGKNRKPIYITANTHPTKTTLAIVAEVNVKK